MFAYVENEFSPEVIVSQAESSHLETLQAEVKHLKEELNLRDQLVEQLSQELFRLVKDNSNFTASEQETESSASQIDRLKSQIAEIDEQVQFYQKQIETRNSEIEQLQTKIKTLTERNQNLEQMLQELPQVYRQKFAQRMQPVKEKVETLQQENQQLQAKLQTLTYRLAARNRTHKDNQVDLPDIQQTDSNQFSNRGNV